jgi:hypothetical protein
MKRDLGSMLAGAAVPGDGAHNFVQSQLNSGEPQLPQYDPSAGWHKGKELGLFAAGFAPGAGIAAASGNMPNADGGFDPSAADDWHAGNYFSAAMKGLGAAGDAAYAVPGIGSAAGARLTRDEEMGAQFGGVRPDIQNARRILSEGPGGLDRLREALGRGVALPAIGAPSLLHQKTSQSGPEET